MKRIILLSLILFFIFPLVFNYDLMAQKPMGNFKYKSYYKKLENANDKKRLKKGIKKLKNNYISSNQLYKVSELFENDDFKLAYVKDAYPQISDKTNSILLIDAFEKESHTVMLWEYIKSENPKYNVQVSNLDSYADYLKLKEKKKDKQYDKIDKDSSEKQVTSTVTKNNDTKINDKDIITELIIFPDATLYNGEKGCVEYLTEKEFSAFRNALSKIDGDEEKTKVFIEYIHKYCFATSQVMELSELLTGDNYKYIFFKTAYDKVYDPENFNFTTQLLNSERLIADIEEYIKNTNITSIEGRILNSPCIVTSEDLSKIKSEIRKEYSSDSKVKITKKMLMQYKCFTSKQISELLSLFSFEADKLEIAKFSYIYTLDKDNYSSVINSFTKYELKEELKEFINRTN